MQDYSSINAILMSQNTSFEEFEVCMNKLAIEKETYLNLFLITVCSVKATHSQFRSYLQLLVNFKNVTGKKSANINYIGYKDHRSVLMHACMRGNRQAIEHLLSYQNLNITVTDPLGKNALFYAVKNPQEQNSIQIINLLLENSPNLIDSQSQQGSTVLFQALETRRFSVFELLLRKGANPNNKLNKTDNTISHEIIKQYHSNKDLYCKFLLLLIKYKANFQIANKQGKTVLEIARDVGINLKECMSAYKSEKEESGVDEDYEFDKESMTTFNQQTKIGDTFSQLCQIESNICSLKVDFSEIDLQSESFHDPQQFEDEDDTEDQLQQNTQTPLDYDIFSKEIYEFSLTCEEKHRNAWILLESFFKNLEKVVKKYGLIIEVVGSFATGLWCNYSDIDINLIPNTAQYLNFESVLQKIYKAMRNRKGELGIDDIYLNKNKINSIKLGLNQRYNNHIVDISIFHRNNQNRQYVTYIIDSMNAHVAVKPLFFAFRKICETFNLHDHIFGGLKTYTLFLMIYSMVKNYPNKTIGELFNGIVLYYGFLFQYNYQIVEAKNRDKVQQNPVLRMNLIDPLNSKNNMGGKNTKAKQVRVMFQALYYCLNQLLQPPYLHQLLELNHIF